MFIFQFIFLNASSWHFGHFFPTSLGASSPPMNILTGETNLSPQIKHLLQTDRFIITETKNFLLNTPSFRYPKWSAKSAEQLRICSPKQTLYVLVNRSRNNSDVPICHILDNLLNLFLSIESSMWNTILFCRIMPPLSTITPCPNFGQFWILFFISIHTRHLLSNANGIYLFYNEPLNLYTLLHIPLSKIRATSNIKPR